MKHRHLDIKPNQWGVAVVESILERGTDQDICELLRECKKQPFGAAADAVRRTIPHSEVYGYPTMFKLFLKRLESKS